MGVSVAVVKIVVVVVTVIIVLTLTGLKFKIITFHNVTIIHYMVTQSEEEIGRDDGMGIITVQRNVKL